MIEFLKEILRLSKANTKVTLLWLGILLLLEQLWSPLKIFSWLLDILKDPLAIKILVSICLLSIGFALTFLHLYLKTKPKIQIEDFKMHPDGYYLNPRYGFEICPKCLHMENPRVAPMTRASGPWQCVACGDIIHLKPASASSEAIPTRKGFGLTHRNNYL